MAQYRPRFAHHAINGTLLQQLDINSLRTELRIAPLGHRHTIMAAIGKLGGANNGLTGAMLRKLVPPRPQPRSAKSRRPSADPRPEREQRARERLSKLPPAEWSAADVEAWAVSIGFAQYAPQFERNAVDGLLLMKLDAEMLRSELQMEPLGHRRAIMAEIDKVASGGNQALRVKQQQQLRHNLRSGAPPDMLPRSAHPPGLRCNDGKHCSNAG